RASLMRKPRIASPRNSICSLSVSGPAVESGLSPLCSWTRELCVSARTSISRFLKRWPRVASRVSRSALMAPDLLFRFRGLGRAALGLDGAHALGLRELLDLWMHVGARHHLVQDGDCFVIFFGLIVGLPQPHHRRRIGRASAFDGLFELGD